MHVSFTSLLIIYLPSLPNDHLDTTGLKPVLYLANSVCGKAEKIMTKYTFNWFRRFTAISIIPVEA